jgi:hypothetical protein
MRYTQICLVSLVIALVLLLTGGTPTVSAHGRSPGCQWHQVRRGETLSGSGRRADVPWRVLAQSNRLPHPHSILAGTYLCVPSGHRVAPAPLLTATSSPAPPPPAAARPLRRRQAGSRSATSRSSLTRSPEAIRSSGRVRRASTTAWPPMVVSAISLVTPGRRFAIPLPPQAWGGIPGQSLGGRRGRAWS